MKDSNRYILISIVLIIAGAIMRDIIHVSLATQRSVGMGVAIMGIVLLTKTIVQTIRSNKKRE